MRTLPIAYIATMIAVALKAGIASAVMLSVVTLAHGQSYPNRPIRVLTTPPGGGAELLARYITQGISGPLGQPMIVDSRAPNVLGENLARAPADGYTLLILGRLLWFQPLIQKTAYDPIRDFAPVSMVGNTPSVLVVHPSLPVKSVKQLIALARSRPGILNYSVGAVGTSGFLAAEFFKSMANVNMVGIPYKGAGLMVAALLAGEVDLTFTTLASVASHVKSGRLRALGVCTLTPSSLAPNLPTVASSGLPGFEAGDLTAMLAPAKTPTAIINRLNEELVRLLNTAETKERYLAAGVEPMSSSPEELAAKIRAEMTQMSTVIKQANIKAEQ